ncbi:MAG: histidine phosphatase family protein, partial [Chloroflexota bacterium]
MQMYLVLIRHGETEANIDWRWTGWTDSPLTSLGEEQVALTAERIGIEFNGNSQVVTSPIGRAYKTAEVLGKAIHVTPRAHDGLKEMYFGELEDIPSEQFMHEHPDIYSRWSVRTDESFQWPGGESRLEFRRRVAQTISDLVSQTNSHPTLVVTHSG